MSSKKGISMILSTILLVALSIIIGALVMSFGGNMTKNITDEQPNPLTCNFDVGIEIISACYTGEELSMVIENTRQLPLADNAIMVQVVQGEHVDLFSTPPRTRIEPGAIKKINIPYINRPEQPEEIALIPVITQDNRNILCTEQRIRADVNPCGT